MNQQQQKPKAKFALGDYVEVSERVQAWYEEFPDGRIETQIVSMTDSLVVTLSRVYRTNAVGELPAGVGHSMLAIPGKTTFTRGAELENCETSSVGRALVMAGIPAKSIASANEIRGKGNSDDHEPRQQRTNGNGHADPKKIAEQHGMQTGDKIVSPVAAARKAMEDAATFARALPIAEAIIDRIETNAPGWKAPGDIVHFAANCLCDLAESQEDLFASSDLLDAKLDKNAIALLAERRTKKAGQFALA